MGGGISHGTTVSGNLIFNVVEPKISGWTMQTINVTSATYQEQPTYHSTTPVLLSFGNTYSCAACGDVNQIITKSTDPTVIITLTHNATYDIRVVGNIVRSRPAPPPQMIETQTTPFDVTTPITFEGLNIISAPDKLINWDPATMTSVNLASSTEDAQTGLQQYKYTISGAVGSVEKTYNDQSRPGQHSTVWDGKNALGVTMEKGIYSTKVNVMSNYPPTVCGDSNRSTFLTISNQAIEFVSRNEENATYRFKYKLTDTNGKNAHGGKLRLYKPDLTGIATWDLETSEITASVQGVSHEKLISVPVASISDPGYYTFILEQCLDDDANYDKEHRQRYAVEAMCRRDLTTDWDVILEKCAANWLPEYGNNTAITATIYPSSFTGIMEFTLNSSSETGICLNNGTTTDKDLKFENQTGFTISSNGSVATTTSNVNSTPVTVHSYDYGAYADLSCKATINGITRNARIRGDSDVFHVEVPRDENGNKIGDAWQYDDGQLATHDADYIPNTVQTGDGFSAYEEYRGFMINGTHLRTSPHDKDVFIYDRDNLGVGDFPDLGFVSHLITNNEWNSSTRIINFNGDNDQCGILMMNGIYKGNTVGEVEEVGTPNVCAWTKIYVESIREVSPPRYTRTDVDAIDSAITARTIAHELGHDVAIYHHVPKEAAPECVMREPCPVADPITHTYCTTTPICKNKPQLH